MICCRNPGCGIQENEVFRKLHLQSGERKSTGGSMSERPMKVSSSRQRSMHKSLPLSYYSSCPHAAMPVRMRPEEGTDADDVQEKAGLSRRVCGECSVEGVVVLAKDTWRGLSLAQRQNYLDGVE